MASKSPAHTISDFVSGSISAALGSTDPTTTSWRIFTGRQGNKPDQCITFYDTGGRPDNPAWRINYPSIQVRVRGAVDDYPGTWRKINDIKEFLVGLEPQDINGDRWSGIVMVSGIVPIGYDHESRPEFTLNLACYVEPAADSSANMHRQSL